MNDLMPESTQGLFWLPRNPDVQVPGRFYKNKDHGLMLDILGTFSGKHVELETQREERVLGIAEDGKLLTLEDCIYRNRRFSVPGLSTSTLHVNLALLGCHFELGEAILFNEIEFRSDAIDKWLEFGGIPINFSTDPDRVIICYSPPPPKEWPLQTGEILTMKCSWQFSPGYQIHEARISKQIWVGFRCAELRGLDDLLKLVQRFVTFVTFASDQPIPIQAVRAYSTKLIEARSKDSARVPVAVFYDDGGPHEGFDPSLISRPYLLFSFQCVAGKLQQVMNYWIANYSKFDASFNLFFSTKFRHSLQSDNRFLMLIQALESLHRYSSVTTSFPIVEYERLSSVLRAACPEEFKGWLKARLQYGNEPSLRQRLKCLFSDVETLFPEADLIKNISHVL